MGKQKDWDDLRQDAEHIKDHIQRWLKRNGVPDPIVYVKEPPKGTGLSRPSKYTFVGATGIDHETVELPSRAIADSQDNLGLLAHGASEIMLAKLRKVTGRIN